MYSLYLANNYEPECIKMNANKAIETMTNNQQ